jgi:hypothetical protein
MEGATLSFRPKLKGCLARTQDIKSNANQVPSRPKRLLHSLCGRVSSSSTEDHSLPFASRAARQKQVTWDHRARQLSFKPSVLPPQRSYPLWRMLYHHPRALLFNVHLVCDTSRKDKLAVCSCDWAEQRNPILDFDGLGTLTSTIESTSPCSSRPFQSDLLRLCCLQQVKSVSRRPQPEALSCHQPR